MKETNAAIALLGKWPEKNLGFQRDSNPRPLCYRCSALPTKLSKPHESRRVMAAFASFILPLFNCYCWTYIIMEFILCPLNKKTLEYLLKTLCLAELTAFQITKLAQVFCWMNLAGKVWKTKDLNNWAGTIMYKIYNNLSPSYLRRIIIKTSNVHEHKLHGDKLLCSQSQNGLWKR